MMNAMAPMMGELLGGLGGAGTGAGGCCLLWVLPAVGAACIFHAEQFGQSCNAPGWPWVLVQPRPFTQPPPLPTPAGSRGRGARQLPANLPLEEALARAGLAPQDAARWKATLEADAAAQAAAPPQAPLSDAYLAALPPRAAAGLLRLEDEEEWSEGEEGEEEGAGGATRSPAAAQ